MKVAIVQKPQASVVIEDRAVPEPKSGEAPIRVHSCDVCHSDLNVLLGLFLLLSHGARTRSGRRGGEERARGGLAQSWRSSRNAVAVLFLLPLWAVDAN